MDDEDQMTQEAPMQNDYMAQVVNQRAQIEQDLRVNRMAKKAASPAGAMAPQDVADDGTRARHRPEGGGPANAPGNAVDVRITGWWRWKNVVVPPNAYVVHTRRGHSEPLHCGLGISFRYNPDLDSFIVAPSAMQTIILQANCISKERQGVLVQGYVQWIIDDFKTAYRKNDFTDVDDPMRIVNVQLREQAEAAIKDKVATLSIDDVLTDKQPIIKELTSRLRHVAEGEGADKGLGLRIVTVQIKEAVVSSPKVWEMLQRPFRSERAKEARLAELTNQAVVEARESEAEKTSESHRIKTESEVSRLTSEAEAAAFDRQESERIRRARAEAQTLAETMEHEKIKMQKQSDLARVRIECELIEAGMRQEAVNRQTERDIAFEGARRQIDNNLSATALQARLIASLPTIAEKMPKPAELKSFSFGGADGLSSLVSGLMKLIDQARHGKDISS